MSSLPFRVKRCTFSFSTVIFALPQWAWKLSVFAWIVKENELRSECIPRSLRRGFKPPIPLVHLIEGMYIEPYGIMTAGG
jgi:hypothetical protein